MTLGFEYDDMMPSEIEPSKHVMMDAKQAGEATNPCDV